MISARWLFTACLQILNSYLRNSGLYIHPYIDTWPLIYIQLSQTMSNNNLNNENLIKKIEDCRRKLLECPSSRLDSHCQLLDDLSNALYHRFQQLGGIEYLEESITCWRQSLNLCAIGDPNHSVLLNNFASALTTRYQQLGRMVDLEEAITCLRQAIALLPHGHPNRSESLNYLANAVYTRFQQLGRTEDLEDAITCHRQAITLRPACTEYLVPMVVLKRPPYAPNETPLEGWVCEYYVKH